MIEIYFYSGNQRIYIRYLYAFFRVCVNCLSLKISQDSFYPYPFFVSLYAVYKPQAASIKRQGTMKTPWLNRPLFIWAFFSLVAVYGYENNENNNNYTFSHYHTYIVFNLRRFFLRRYLFNLTANFSASCDV